MAASDTTIETILKIQGKRKMKSFLPLPFDLFIFIC